MVGTLTPQSSFNPRTTSQQRNREAPTKTPLWLFAFYALFAFVCMNTFWTYQDQKKLVLSRIEKESETVETQYSAGAEEHVVTTGVGSSQYGGSLKAALPKKKKKKKSLGTNFNHIRPEPSNGSNDYRTKHSASEFNGFSFYVIADTPYTEVDESRLRSQMAELRNCTENSIERNITFGIHLGGTQKDSQCAESTYENHADLIAAGPRPTLVTPGKSDWFDCPRRDEAFGFFLQHLGPGLETKWQAHEYENLNIKRSEQNPELFSLYVEGILLIGLHIIDTPADQEYVASRDKRMEASMQWLAESIEGNFAEREIRGVIILGHAGESERNEKFFSRTRKYFDANGLRKDIPVLYMHGDGLTWQVAKNRSPFYDIQVDQGGLAEPCIVDVAPRRNGKRQFLRKDETGMQTTLGKGLFLLDQRKGRYTDLEKTP